MDPKSDDGLYGLGEPDVRTVVIPEGQNFKVMATSRLAVVKGHDSGKDLNVRKERVSIGRSEICDLVLTDRAVSKFHAEVITHERGRLLRDLGSRNGVLFMGHRVNELSLKPGTQFQLGNNLLRFEPLDVRQKIPLSKKNHFGKALGVSIGMRELFAVLERVSPSDISVLLLGETGTGKELIVSAVHKHSRRCNRPFVVLNCAAIPADLVESTIFGHVKGAFTGAKENRRGVFEEAHGGTLFLDEVGELPLEMQPKLLRAAEQREVQRVGAVKKRLVDVRIVTATNRDLRDMVEKNLFREDLLYRLSGIEVRIPSLRERPEDIQLLAEHFLEEGNRLRARRRLPPMRLEKEAVSLMESYPWPGNVRELRNIMESAMNLAEGNSIGRTDLQALMDLPGGGRRLLLVPSIHGPYRDAKNRLLEQFERQYLSNLMRECDGNLTAAARQSGLVRHHLRDLCKRNAVPFGHGSYR